MGPHALSVEVDRIGRQEWDCLLERFEDASLYQTWSWAAVRWGANRISHLVVSSRREVLAAAQAWIIKAPFGGPGIAHVKWGPLWRVEGRGADLGLCRAVVRALKAEYVDRRGLILRVVPVAYEESAAQVSALLAAEGFRPGAGAGNYRTLVLPLTAPPEELRAGMKRKWRQQLNRARKNGLTVVEGAEEALFETVRRLYLEMKARKRFADFLPVEEVMAVHRDLPARLKMTAMVCAVDGRPVAGQICARVKRVATPMVAATVGEGLELGAAYRLEWEMIARMQAAGCHWYDLGGIDPERYPGPFHFKAGLSGKLGRDVAFAEYTLCRGAANRLLLAAGNRLWRARRRVKALMRR